LIKKIVEQRANENLERLRMKKQRKN